MFPKVAQKGNHSSLAWKELLFTLAQTCSWATFDWYQVTKNQELWKSPNLVTLLMNILILPPTNLTLTHGSRNTTYARPT